MAAAAGLDGGFLVRAEHVVVLAERLAVEDAGVQVEHHGGSLREVRCARRDPGPVLPGFERVAAKPAAHGGAADRLDHAGGDRLVGQFRAGPP
jgi:hypothetical protein